jgi:hypothetical protein
MCNYKLVEVKIMGVCRVVSTAVIWRFLIQNMGVVLSVFCVIGTLTSSATCVSISSNY